MLKIVLVSGAALLLVACQSDSQRDRALVGGGLGAATGAVIGSAIDGGGVGGALVGAAVGGVGGAMVGSATTPKNCIATDRYGRRYRVACP
ncbi:glycine zipper domain-containing protein [Stappia sp.]|uniref:glycine zipper domain-containing protein n=1 Tax=Stappia sp. TaxID=1870903 RepID=UPI0032D9841E